MSPNTTPSAATTTASPTPEPRPPVCLSDADPSGNGVSNPGPSSPGGSIPGPLAAAPSCRSVTATLLHPADARWPVGEYSLSPPVAAGHRSAKGAGEVDAAVWQHLPRRRAAVPRVVSE